MKLNKLLGKLSLLGIMSLIIMLSACTDKAKTIGVEVDNQGNIFEVGFTDTSSVRAHSFLIDSLRTDSIPYNSLGSMLDPVMGETTADIVVQLLPVIDTFDFGPNPVVDSMILFMKYAGSYGDTTDFQTINIYELDEVLDFPKAYYSDDIIKHKTTLLASKTFAPRPYTHLEVPLIQADTIAEIDTIVPQISFNIASLSTELADKILNAPEEHMVSSSAFVEYVNGLYIEAEKVSDGGSISYFDLLTSLSRVTLYYHNDTIEDLSYQLVISQHSERASLIDHNNYDDASQEFKDQTINEQIELGTEQVYLQGLAGVEAKIVFPHIANLKDLGTIVINQAELVLSVDAVNMEGYASPIKLSLLQNKEDGTYEILADQFEGDDYFGGNYVEDDNEYRFRITKYIQDLVNSDAPDIYGLNLAISGSSLSASRLIVYGTNPSNAALYSGRLRLELTYSIVND